MNKPLQSIRDWLAVAETAAELGMQIAFIAAMREVSARAVLASVTGLPPKSATRHPSPVTLHQEAA